MQTFRKKQQKVLSRRKRTTAAKGSKRVDKVENPYLGTTIVIHCFSD